jgi:hypothetical protein
MPVLGWLAGPNIASYIAALGPLNRLDSISS